MFGLGTWEIILILVAALIFIGPDKLPQVAKTIGKGLRQVRGAMSQVDAEVRRAADDFVRSAEEDERKDAREAEREARKRRLAESAAGAPELDRDGTRPDPDDLPASRSQGFGDLGPSGLPEQAPPTDPSADDGSIARDAPATTDGPEGRDWTAHASAPIPGRVAAVPPTRGARAHRVVDVPPPAEPPPPEPSGADDAPSETPPGSAPGPAPEDPERGA